MKTSHCGILITITLLWFTPAICLATGQPGILESSHAANSANQSSAIDLVLERYAKSVLPWRSKDVTELHQLAHRYAVELNVNGSWNDINYSDTSRSSWQAAEHLNRTLIMAKWAHAARDAGTPDAMTDVATRHALDYWLQHDPRNPNWWWNQIGVPQLLGEIAALIEGQLPPSTLSGVTSIMRRSTWAKVPWTGANLIWGVEIEIVRGCLEHNSFDVSEGYSRMYQEIKIVSPRQEGIQQDDSFHQHGEQLYNGGYGLNYANDVGRFVAYAWGTKFQIPAKQLAIFSSYILDGEQWMTTGDIIDYSTIGREITRKGLVVAPADWTMGPISPAGPAYSLPHVVHMLAALPTPRQAEFRAFAARLLQSPQSKSFTGNKQFWRSDFMVQRSPNYTTSVKMLSSRMQNAEVTNGEGRKSEHLSDGANFLYLTGDEYKDIFPVWDWTKVPGTTAIQGTLDTGEKNAIGAHGGSAFAGGVSDGRYGMAAMDLRRGPLAAEKAWFFFEDEYVCLGAGITLSGLSDSLATDVNQTLLNGPVSSNLSTGVLPTGLHTYTLHSSSWFYHDHVGYIFSSGTHVSLSVGPQTGRWSDIGSGSSESVTRNVFDLWINHGASPRGGTYQYVVLPGASAKETARRTRNPHTRILTNNSDIQAVWNKHLHLGMFAFHNPGSLATPAGTITVDHACLVMLRKISHHWEISASSPENRAFMLHVKLANRQIAMPLPGGNFAGSSVTMSLNNTSTLQNISGSL